jgi:cell division septation protein DedD
VSDGLKQRIIGALVLGALGLIILPVLFDFADPLKIDRARKTIIIRHLRHRQVFAR